MYNAEEFFKEFEEDAYFHVKEFAWNYKPIPEDRRQACDDFAVDFFETQDFKGDIKSYCRKYFRFYSLRVYDALEVFFVPLFLGENIRALRLANLIMSLNCLLTEHLYGKYNLPENLSVREHLPEQYCKDLYILYHELAHELGMLALKHAHLISNSAREELLSISDDLQLLGNVMPLFLKMISYIDGTELWR